MKCGIFGSNGQLCCGFVCFLFSDLSNNKINALTNSSFANMSQLTTLYVFTVHETSLHYSKEQFVYRS